MDEETRYMRVIGVFVRELRQRAGPTQTKLADRMGSTKPTFSRWERGLSCPTLWEMRTFAQAIGVAFSRICEETETVAASTNVRTHSTSSTGPGHL